MSPPVHFASYYRWLVVSEHLRADIPPTSLLDVGCYDGYFLSRLEAALKVGVDLAPPPARDQHYPVMRADVHALPFSPGAFDTILAFDVLEHVEDDRQCLASLVRLLSPQGRLLLSVPCRGFSIFPGFLTDRAERGWGHVRRGYSRQGLESILLAGASARIVEWNEPVFRAVYLALRLVYPVWPALARLGSAWCFQLDRSRHQGESGHLFAEVTVPGELGSPQAGEVSSSGAVCRGT